MAAKVNAAVVGAGFIGRKTHVEGFLKAGANVLAICDTDAARAESAAKEYNIKAFTDFRRMMRELPEINAVAVAVPNKFHKPVAMAALSAGKNVICDKPMAMNAREAGEMVDRAKEKKVVLALHLQQRYAYRSRWLRKEIEKGMLGELYHAKASILRVNAIPRGWFHVKKFAGGGALMDLGPHLIDVTWALMGKPRPLSASGYSYSKLGIKGAGFGGWGVGYETGHGMDTEDLAGGLIRFEGGKTIEIEASWAVHLDEPTLQCTFFGDRAGAKLFPHARIFTLGKKLKEKKQPEGKDMTPFHDFVKCIKTGGRPDAAGEDGLAVMKMIDAIYKSASSGKEARI